MVQRLATGWTVRDLNADGGETFRTHPDQPSDPPGPTEEYKFSFLGVKRQSMALATHPYLEPKKSTALPPVPL